MQLEVPVQQILHDLANVVQTLTFISEEEPLEIERVKIYLERLSFLIKIYSQIYSVSEYTDTSFNELIDLIQESKTQMIELTGDSATIPKLVKRILLLYIAWARDEITIQMETSKVIIITQERPIRIKKILLDQMASEGEVTILESPEDVTITWS